MIPLQPHALRSLTVGGAIEPASGSAGRATEYRCTPSGRAALRELLLDLLHEDDFQPLSLIPLLYFTPTLTAEELDAGLAARIHTIDDALAIEDEVFAQSDTAGPSHATEIFRLMWRGLRADRDWCEEFRSRLASRQPSQGSRETRHAPSSSVSDAQLGDS
ncbi:hypothetical protein QE410_000520 [Microbacterium sp. SORGH_AS 1204]|nr:hypothetical protein [Microbacterium sp. SORGH_AS_1204]